MRSPAPFPVVVVVVVVIAAVTGSSSWSPAARADASKAPSLGLPQVFEAAPKGVKPFLHAVITHSDVAALSDADEKIVREISDGEGDDGYLETGFLTTALLEARALGAGGIVIARPLLRTQTLVDNKRRPYTIVTTLEADFYLRQGEGGRFPQLMFVDEWFPTAKTCNGGSVVVTSEDSTRAARWPSRVELIEAMARKAGHDRFITDLKFEPAQRGGRKLRGTIRLPQSNPECAAAAGAVKNVKLKRRDRHFYAALVVNGVKLGDALIDTGATSLALPAKWAQDAGVDVVGGVRLETASGVVEAKKGRAEVVTIGGLPVRAVDIAILPGGGDALIGMSVLEAFDIAVSGETMTLTAH